MNKRTQGLAKSLTLIYSAVDCSHAYQHLVKSAGIYVDV